MNRLRVAHVITQLELGGAQRNTLYTVGHLERSRFEPVLITGPEGMLDEEARRGDWKTFFVPSLARPVHPVKDLIALVALYRLLRWLKPHVLHTHSSKAGILARLAGYVAGVPVIIHTFHGFGFTPGQRPLARKLFISLERFCARLSMHLIFVSRDNEALAQELGIGAGRPHSLIRSGIAVQTLAMGTPIREELGLTSTTWVVACVGNFKPQKNPLDLVRVAAEALPRHPDMHFLLVGDGELRPEAEALAQELGVTANVHFLGWRQDIPAIFAAANCFLLTSLWEGLPRALVEAFAARRPAIAYGVDGVRDILSDGENGFLIPPGDKAMAAEKILWLVEHPFDALTMGERGRSRVEREFDIDAMVRQQEALYTSLYEAVPLRDYYEPQWIPPEIS